MKSLNCDAVLKRVLIYGPKDPPGGVEQMVFRYVREIVRKHPEISFDFLVYGDFSMEKRLCESGCRVFHLPSRARNYAKYRIAMRKIFKENTYAAVWGNYSGLTNTDLLKMAKAYHVPVRVAHSHTTGLYWENRFMQYLVPVMHLFNKKFLPCYATDFWSCSEESGTFLFPEKVHRKVQVIANALNLQEFLLSTEKRRICREEFGLTPEQLVIGQVARMCPVKNQFFLLRVFAEVIKIKPDARLLLVGDGEMREALYWTAEVMDIADKIIFTGEREDIPDLYCAMDIFVLCSHAEGLSVSAVEAQASGLPCLLSDTITKETDLSGLAAFLSLKKGEKVWAEEIVKLAQGNQESAEERIHNRLARQQIAWKRIGEHGYEISEAAEKVYRKLSGGE